MRRGKAFHKGRAARAITVVEPQMLDLSRRQLTAPPQLLGSPLRRSVAHPIIRSEIGTQRELFSLCRALLVAALSLCELLALDRVRGALTVAARSDWT
jgi:hypothetical protein